MSRTFILSIMLLMLAAVGCEENPGSEPIGLNVVYAFAPAGNISLTADTDHIRPSGEMLLTVRGISKVTGVGTIVLTTSSQEPGGMVIIDSPIQDTIRNPAPAADTVPKKKTLPFSFVANQEFVIPWHIRITNIEYHRFGAAAFIDSVFIPDSGRSYAAQTDTVKRYMKVPHGTAFDTDAGAVELQIRP